MCDENGPVVEWYNGRSIFITGGTGFMGKVLVEKLLYSCTGVKNIYLFLREKRGKTAQQRINEMWNLPLFERLKKSQPEAFKKVVPITGTLGENQLGIKKNDMPLLEETVSVVFHCAAYLRMDGKLKEAIAQNVGGTAKILDLAKKMKNLKAFVHFSTTFCSADLDVFEEKVYPDISINPRDIIEIAAWMNDEALEIATPSIIKPHPDTYTFTKRLAENLVSREGNNLPIVIVRPSVVMPALYEPIPGWVDTLNGPIGIIVAASKGVLRSMYCKSDMNAQVIPVDIAISGAIIAAQQKGSTEESSKEVSVYNATQNDTIPVTIKEILEKGRKAASEYPFEQLWYPDGDFRATYTSHLIHTIFLHWIPALLLDLILFIFRQKTFAIRVQKRIHHGLTVMQYYSTRHWIFINNKFKSLFDNLKGADKKTFPLNLESIDIDEYVKNCILGARIYVMKEDPSTLPRCRVRQWILYILNKVLVYGIYGGLFYYTVSNVALLSSGLDHLKDYAAPLPFMKRIIPWIDHE